MKIQFPLALAALLISGSTALACLHLPADYAGSLAQQAQGGLIFWNKGRQELVLKNSFEISGDALPTSLAWVVPVPTEPDAYGVADPALFQSLHDLWEQERNTVRDRTGEVVSIARSRGGPPTDGLPEDARQGGIELLEQVSVGEYDIQPIRTRGPESGEALNRWLTGNGFGAVPAENMRYYVERDWIWLAVKIDPARGAAGIEASGEVRPLRIAFPSDRIVYPLKFSSHQGAFDVVLWVVTDEPLQGWAGAAGTWSAADVGERDLLGDYGFDGHGKWLPLPADVDAAQRTAAGEHFSPLTNTLGEKVPHVTRIEGHVDGALLSAWERDFELSPGER